MAAPVIALRFRDTTPDVDTIRAHESILEREGAVWWGWWKKAFEDDHLTYLNTLASSLTPQSSVPIEILIVDRSTKRMFCAKSSRLSIGGSGVDLTRVPKYYQDYAAQVFCWFLLLNIEPVSFDDNLALSFGDHTLIRLDSQGDRRTEKVAATASALSKSCLLHLSDLHFGADYAFTAQNERPPIGDPRRTLTKCLSDDLDRLALRHDIAAVVVTGDFTTRGDWRDGTREQVIREFGALRTALNLQPEQIVAVPGNHDIVRYPPGSAVDLAKITVENQTRYQHETEFRTFVDDLIGRNWKESLNYVRRISLTSVDILICVLNSCTITATQWTEYGFVGDSGLDAINQLKDERIDRPTYKFIALHHHLLPVAAVEVPDSKGVTLSLDASALLDHAQEAGVHFALHGHQHMPRLAKYQTIPLMNKKPSLPLHVISNGSTGAKRLPGNERNTYCIFRLDDEIAHLWMREIRPDGKEGTTLFEDALGVSPLRSITA